MKHEKKIKVVMLATDKETDILLSRRGNLQYLNTNSSKNINNNFGGIFQYLYFLSNEEIKEGDWIYNDETISQVESKTINTCKSLEYKDGKHWFCINKNCKKIISSTDKSLNLPRPSNSFIQKFVEEYNSGNIIEEVMVEYEGDWDEYYKAYYAETVKLKVASDNTITIKPVVEDWDAIYKEFISQYNHVELLGITERDYNIWLKENYNPPTKKK